MSAGFMDLIQPELDSVNQIIEKTYKIRPGHLGKFAYLETDYLQKYLHPALVLLSGKILNYSGEKIKRLAAAIQLIYLASSVQFRIPDESETAHEDPREGSQYPVLVGNYLYGQYFLGLCEGQILEFLNPLAEIIKEMNHGALLRKKNSGRPVADEKIAMNIIEKETALLMEGAAKFPGKLAGAGDEMVSNLAGFGWNFGMGYGIMERNLGREMAQDYFIRAVEILQTLPGGAARDALEEIVLKIQNGEKVITIKKFGRSSELKDNVKENLELPEQYTDKEEYVHSIFSSIAKKYDTLNTVLSFNQDKYWRKFTVKQTGLKPGGTALDVCCGTGMITMELARQAGPGGKVVGLDFCEEMLAIAQDNIKGSGQGADIEFVRGNAMELPFADNTFDCVTIGFGLRNVPDMKKTIREMSRVAKPGGRIVCLEFSKPTVPVFKQIYNFYFDKWVPFLGKLGVGIDGPYRYLHKSWKAFPHQKELKDEFVHQGLNEVVYHELTGGVVSVHTAVKPLSVTVSSVAATKE